MRRPTWDEVRYHGTRWAWVIGLAVLAYLAFPSSATDLGPLLEPGAKAGRDVVAPFDFVVTKTDEELKKVDKRQFRNYYGLRASVTASLGSHDEWNIVRMINEKRRHDAHKSEFGIARQVAVLFEGNALPPGPTETSTASGNSGRCPQ